MQLSDRIGRRMKLQDLHILMTVIQSGSMRKAAQSLNITQPAISRSIAELEHALGVRLLERHRQGIEATDCGRALLDCGVAVFDELRQGVRNVEFLADPTAGEVRIGNALVSASSFFAPVIDRLSRRYPRVVFHVVPAGPDILHRELNARSVELVIARGGAPCLGMSNLVSKLSTTTRLSCSQVRKIHGPGGAGSSSPNWSTNLGRCRRRKARLRRSRWKHFAPAGLTVRA